jgi:hypothetical protein
MGTLHRRATSVLSFCYMDIVMNSFSRRLGRDRFNLLRPSIASVLSALFALFSVTLAVSPMNGEDYGLSLPLSATTNLDRIGSIAAFVWNHAIHWNARLGECLAIIELNLPRYLYVLIQSAASAAFISATSMLAVGNRRERTGLLATTILSTGVTYLAWPKLEIFFWETVAAGYLQPLVFILFLVLIAGNTGARENVARSPAKTVGYLCLGLVCGFSFENVSPALVVYLLVLAFITWSRHGPEWRLLISISIAVGVGWVALMIVPSTSYRQHFYRELFHTSPWSISQVLGRAVDVASVFLSISWPLIILAILGLFAIAKAERTLRKDFDLILLLIPAVLSTGAVLFAPYTEPRAFVFSWAIMLAIAIRGAHRLADKQFVLLAIAASMVAIPVAGYTLSTYAEFAVGSKIRSNYIEDALGTPACSTGLPIDALKSSAPSRILNNREEWVFNSLNQVSTYFGCNLVPRR